MGTRGRNVDPGVSNPSVSHPSSHDFGLCPVKVHTPHQFTLKNTGTSPISYRWEVPVGHANKPLPFVAHPETGGLEPGETTTVRVSFYPEEASVFVAALVCRFEGKTSVFKVSGVGKYPFIRVKGPGCLDFGEVYVGRREEKQLVLTNQSQVPATFKISSKETKPGLRDPFTFSPSTDTIPPEASMPIKVTYTPKSSGLLSLHDYAISVQGTAPITVSCQGSSIGPQLLISTRQIHFGEVNLDLKTPPKAKVVKITNKSPLDCVYQVMMAASDGVFPMDPTGGVLKPNASVNLTVKFTPTEPANYHRRVYILGLGAFEPLWVDLMGGAYMEKRRPPAFEIKHVQQMRARGKVGLGRVTPEEICEMLRGDDGSEEAAAAREALDLAMDPPSFTSKAAFMDVARGPCSAEDMPFSLDESELDFGCVRVRSGEIQTITVLNNTSSKATAVWVVPASHQHRFKVEPPTADIPPHSGTQFTIRALPAETSSISAILECFAFFATMRSFRLVTDGIIIPPTCLLLRCNASGGGRLYPVSASLSTTSVEFPPVHQSDTVFQTVSVTNRSDTPIIYTVRLSQSVCQIDEDEKAARQLQEGSPYASLSHENTVSDIGLDTEQVFDVFPSKGVIKGGQSQILLLRFKAVKASLYRCKGEVTFDHQDEKPVGFALTGTGYTPSLTLRNDATVFVRSTFVGSSTVRGYVIENTCRIPLAYHWEMPSRLRGIVKITPEDGVLQGNEKATLKIDFTPDKVKKYVMQIPVVCMSRGESHSETAERQMLTIIGEGLTGDLTIEPLQINIETVRTGDSACRTLTLFNSTSVEVWYGLGWVATGDEQMPIDPSEVTITPETGVVPVRAHKTVKLTFTPRRRGAYSFTVYCRTLSEAQAAPQAWSSTKSVVPTAAELECYPSCVVSGTGGYPTVQVTDVKCVTISKAHLWGQASVEEINEHLKQDVMPDDVNTRHFEFKTICEKIRHLPVSFGAAVEGSAAAQIFMTLQNVSEIPVAFSFLLPHDSDFPIEKWFHEEPPTEDDLAQEHIAGNRLFIVSPQTGHIAPHDSVMLTLTYQRKVAGTHVLPVLFKIHQGKKLVLDLIGTTLEEGEGHLDFTAKVHHFAPVAIGDIAPPMQYFEMRNTSSVAVSYELAAEPFSNMCDEAYDFPVFQCLNSYGEIPPCSSAMLQWYFRPLEAREYQMTVPIVLQKERKTYEVTFVGTGYHPKHQHLPVTFNPVSTFPTLGRNPAFPVVLSQDVVTFGRISVHSLHRRVLIVRNTHESDAFSYDWDTEAGMSGEQILEVHPAAGEIPPGGHVVCKLALYSGSVPIVMDQSLQCRVVNASLQRRREQLRREEEEQAAMALEPEVAESVSSPGRGGGHSGGAWNGKSFGTTGSRSGKGRKRPPVTQLPPKYQTTSQLRQTMARLIEAANPENIDEDSPDLSWIDAPETVVDTRIQAHVMGFEAFKAEEPELWDTQYLPTVAVYQQHIDPPETATATGGQSKGQQGVGVVETEDEDLLYNPPTEEELEFVMGHLAGLLREVVRDPLIGETYLELDETPVRYFAEFANPPENDAENDANGTEEEPSEDPPEEVAFNVPEETEESINRRLLQNGEFQSLIEEVLESAIYEIILDSAMCPDDEAKTLVPSRGARMRLAKQIADSR